MKIPFTGTIFDPALADLKRRAACNEHFHNRASHGVWRNEAEAGIRCNVVFSRINKDGDSWNSTDSFGRDDQLLLGKVADQAHSWIFQQSQEENKATKSASHENDEC
jgi:hypothetical protein